MVWLQCEYKSTVLNKLCSLQVLLPRLSSFSPRRPEWPVLYLLHGLSDNATAWMRFTSIERYAERHGVAVVMPDGGRSFYTDMVDGLPYWTAVAEELPELAAELFPVSRKPECNFVAGLSMGGYGALKMGLRHPERFAAVGALSAVTDVKNLVDGDEVALRTEMRHIFGSYRHAVAAGNDLFSLAESAIRRGVSPRIIQICGTGDFLYSGNLRFRDHLKKLNYPAYEYYEEPGAHTWDFWDRNIQRVLDFMLPVS